MAGLGPHFCLVNLESFRIDLDTVIRAASSQRWEKGSFGTMEYFQLTWKITPVSKE